MPEGSLQAVGLQASTMLDLYKVSHANPVLGRFQADVMGVSGAAAPQNLFSLAFLRP